MATLLTFYLTAIICTTVIWGQGGKEEMQTKHRQKRAWVIPPKRLMENVDYTKVEYIAKIRSDEETRTDIVYSLIGPSVVEGLFSVDKTTGFVRIHGILDREKTATYELKGRATSKRDGKPVENDLDLKIIVLDQNDNAPEFKLQMIGSVDELSDKDTHVIAITAFDADEENTSFSKIAYKVIQQEPAGEIMFRIERSSGEIKVKLNTLDRETQDTYKLIITATDLDGGYSDSQNIPKTGTGTVTINIRDVNDNIPVLEKESYEGSVEENIMNVEAIRIKAVDKDLINTSNWEAVFTIISGNEAGHFSITTDPKTNEGILVVDKKLDFEELNEVNLIVVVNNKSPYHKSVVIEKPITYPIRIKVVNVPEAPHFHPAVKVVSISEDHTTIDLKKVIATYTATDSDTLLTATNVRYVKGEDVDNWLSINEQTGEIKLKKYPDRESKFLTDGTYYTKILCITNEILPETATGTLAIQVSDSNDHCPLLTHSVVTLCYGNNVVYVTATDGDKYPNAEPFEFRVVTKGTKETWSVERLNETTVILRSQEDLWPGQYTVELDVLDQQEKSCESQKLQVTVCRCTEAQVCQSQRRSSTGIVLGVSGALALLLGILIFLLIPVLLLLCEFGGPEALGTFKAFPFEDQNQQLITYHIEGKPEVSSALIQVPINVNGIISGQLETGLGAYEGHCKSDWESQEDYIKKQWSVNQHKVDYFENEAPVMEGYSEFFTKSTIDSIALPVNYLGEYYTQKTIYMGNKEAAENQLLVTAYETCNSLTSSLEDICSHLDENNLDFLKDLGPPFKRLAEICCGSSIHFKDRSISTSPKKDLSGSQVGIKVQGAVDSVHNKATAVSASTTQITTNYDERVITGGATSAAKAGLVQQPADYLSYTPMYIMEQQHQPALFLASGPVLGVQENVVLVEKGHTNMAVIAQNTLPLLELQQANTRVLVDQGIGNTVLHGLPGHSEAQATVPGIVQFVENQRVQRVEPVHVVQSSSQSSIKCQSMKATGQSTEIGALGNAPAIPSVDSSSQQDVPRFAAQGFRVSKENFQSSSTS
ncbi:desmoglein-2-like protein [Clarias gariepinus]